MPQLAIEKLTLAARAANRQLFNPTCIRYRQFDGHIATAKNSGTHWIKYLLSHAIAEHYDLPPPKTVRDESLVGHTKTPPAYDNIPQICTTHSQPHYLMRFGTVHKGLNLPHFVVLVRDLRAILVSLYEKWYKDDPLAEREGITCFMDYLRHGLDGKPHVETLWGLIQFYNSWGSAARACPDRIIIVHYEDMIADPLAAARRIADHVGLAALSGECLQRAIAKSDRRSMKANMDEDAVQGERVVNLEKRNAIDWYGPDERAFVTAKLTAHLRHDLGYDFDIWENF